MGKTIKKGTNAKAKSTITCANVNATQGFKKKGKR